MAEIIRRISCYCKDCGASIGLSVANCPTCSVADPEVVAYVHSTKEVLV